MHKLQMDMGRKLDHAAQSADKSDCADLNIVLRPDHLWLIARLERDQMAQLGRSTGKPALVLRDALRNLT